MAMFGLLRNLKQERTGFVLYGAAVQAARAPAYYTTLGVPDTLDGRFDLVGIHAFLLIRRLRAPADKLGIALGQSVFDAMFSDMDITLREIGVGDMSIGKRVRAMWEAFHGRAAAYEAAMPDPALLAETLARNVWRGEPGGASLELARIMQAQSRHLTAQQDTTLYAGNADFLTPEAALA